MALVSELIELIEEDLRVFNVDRFYGGDSAVTSGAIVDAARTLPLLAPRRVLIALQAESILTPKRETRGSELDQATLAAYVKAPAPHACLVFVCRELDERRSLVKLLIKHATVVRCDGLADPAEAARWVRETAHAHGLTVQPRALQLFVERAAGDVDRVRGGAERLFLYASGRRIVTVADVEATTAEAGMPSGEWAVTNAIERGAAAEALRELAAQFEAGTSPYLILGQLAWCARAKLDRRRVHQAVDAVFRADLALKSSGGDPRVVLERLVVELCQPS